MRRVYHFSPPCNLTRQETPGSCAAGKRATRAAVGVLLAGRYDSQTETLPQNAPFGQ